MEATLSFCRASRLFYSSFIMVMTNQNRCLGVDLQYDLQTKPKVNFYDHGLGQQAIPVAQ